MLYMISPVQSVTADSVEVPPTFIVHNLYKMGTTHYRLSAMIYNVHWMRDDTEYIVNFVLWLTLMFGRYRYDIHLEPHQALCVDHRDVRPIKINLECFLDFSLISHIVLFSMLLWDTNLVFMKKSLRRRLHPVSIYWVSEHSVSDHNIGVTFEVAKLIIHKRTEMLMV